MRLSHLDTLGGYIVGVPKSGSTWLANALSQHPDIQLSNPKEPNFFPTHKGTFGRNMDNPAWDEYKQFFIDDNRIKIDASIHTFACPLAPKRIYEKFPNMKFILCIREPISRAFSHWRMIIETEEDKKHNANWSDFSSAWQDERLRDDSLYGKSMKRWLKYFDINNFIIIDSSLMKNKQKEALQKIEHFLGLDPHNYDLEMIKNANKASDRRPLTPVGNILKKIFSSTPGFLKGSIVKRLQNRGINIYSAPIISSKGKSHEITNSHYLVCHEEIIDDLVLFESITGFSIKKWIDIIDKNTK